LENKFKIIEITEILEHDLLVFLSHLIVIITVLNILFKIYLEGQILLALDTFKVSYMVSNRLIFLLSFVSLVTLRKISVYK